ncbi:hypothetical protein C7S20_12705 [Christiangramia fulva]|uniref:Uncharacterized protein n=1 Tax=Christiangramia fulva TaxID=2126553 RepID=A0A2R3Z724_9FLAO|nr:hypothetical protein C7S20_12705 [Christiangramia fulva]
MEQNIFKKVIDHEIEKGTTRIYIECEKSKTAFDLKDFKENVQLEIPENILKEIEQNGATSKNENWNSKFISKLNYPPDILKSKKCLTKKNVELLFQKTNKRQNVISISKPIFDDNYENCIVSVTFWKFTGSAYGYKCFLTKIYGIWTVVVEYAQWMT